MVVFLVVSRVYIHVCTTTKELKCSLALMWFVLMWCACARVYDETAELLITWCTMEQTDLECDDDERWEICIYLAAKYWCVRSCGSRLWPHQQSAEASPWLPCPEQTKGKYKQRQYATAYDLRELVRQNVFWHATGRFGPWMNESVDHKKIIISNLRQN